MADQTQIMTKVAGKHPGGRPKGPGIPIKGCLKRRIKALEGRLAQTEARLRVQRKAARSLRMQLWHLGSRSLAPAGEGEKNG